MPITYDKTRAAVRLDVTLTKEQAEGLYAIMHEGQREKGVPRELIGFFSDLAQAVHEVKTQEHPTYKGWQVIEKDVASGPGLVVAAEHRTLGIKRFENGKEYGGYCMISANLSYAERVATLERLIENVTRESLVLREGVAATCLWGADGASQAGNIGQLMAQANQAAAKAVHMVTFRHKNDPPGTRRQAAVLQPDRNAAARYWNAAYPDDEVIEVTPTIVPFDWRG